MMSPAFNNPFQELTPDDEIWLSHYDREGAKELVVEALLVCIALALPASSSPGGKTLAEDELRMFLRRWYSIYYEGTAFKIAMDTNIQTAIEIHSRWRSSGSRRELGPFADSFLRSALKLSSKLIQN
jgi:hypothetical protein